MDSLFFYVNCKNRPQRGRKFLEWCRQGPKGILWNLCRQGHNFHNIHVTPKGSGMKRNLYMLSRFSRHPLFFPDQCICMAIQAEMPNMPIMTPNNFTEWLTFNSVG